jgi:hypothetical protein
MTKKITVQEEGVTISEGVRVLNFIGAGATASGDGSIADIAIPGGGGGSPALPPTDLYVSTNDGDDGNDGLTPVTAFATITKAINTVGEAAPANYAPIIHIASGTYNAQQLQGVTWPALTRESSGIIFWGDGGGQPGDDGCTEIYSGTITGMTNYAKWGSNNEVSASFSIDKPDEGMTLEITSGVNAGQRRTIIGSPTGDPIILAYGFDQFQDSGTCRVFRPAVIIDDSTADGDVRRQFRMMPPSFSHGFTTDFETNLVDSNEPSPSAPACVWVNVLLDNSAGNTITQFLFAGGQACLFGVVSYANVQLDLQGLFIGTTKSLLPQSNTVVFDPAPTLQPLKNAVSNIKKKWNGWGFNGGLDSTHVGRMSSLAIFMSDDCILQGLRMALLKGLYGEQNFELYNCITNVSDSFFDDGSEVVVYGGSCELSNTVTVNSVRGTNRSFIRCSAQLTATNTVAYAENGSVVHVDMSALSNPQQVELLGSGAAATPSGDNSAPGTAVLYVDKTQAISYFIVAKMGIMGSDGSVIMASSIPEV